MLLPPTRGARGRRSGFTLIELLVVILIISVLLAVAIPLYMTMAKQSAKNVTKANMKAIAAAAAAYRLRNGKYPPDFDNDDRTGADAPTSFIGTNQDLENVPYGPRGVWYSWGMSNGSFLVTATEGGEDIWGTTGNGTSKAYFRLTTASNGVASGRFYVQNGAELK